MAGASVAAPACTGAVVYTTTYPLNTCTNGAKTFKTADAALAGITLDTTTVSNGIPGIGAPGISSASALTVSGLALCIVALVSGCMLAPLQLQ